jgi:hypothetical protein
MYLPFAELTKGYEKDRVKQEKNLRHAHGWSDKVGKLKKTIWYRELLTSCKGLLQSPTIFDFQRTSTWRNP